MQFNEKCVLSANRPFSHTAQVNLYFPRIFLSTALTAGLDEWLDHKAQHVTLLTFGSKAI